MKQQPEFNEKICWDNVFQCIYSALFKATHFLNMLFTNNAKDGFIPTDDWIIVVYTTSLELASVLEDIAWKLTVTVQIIWLYFFPPCISQSERVANFIKLVAVNYILSSVLILWNTNVSNTRYLLEEDRVQESKYLFISEALQH